MNNDVIVYRNRIEIKVLKVVYMLSGIPALILLIYSSISTPSNLLALLIFPFFIIPLFIINRFKIVFDFSNGFIKYTGYFKKTRIFDISNVVVRLNKGKTSLLNDYVFDFIVDDNTIFKINSIDFVGQTSKSVDCLKEILVQDSRILWELEKNLVIQNGYLVINSYSFSSEIATVYLANGTSIYLGYIESEEKFTLKINGISRPDDQLEKIDISESSSILETLQQAINKYDS